ncbi:hypothetical protein PGT21_001964 [Puccinia graminis f. sp. tritici]|uniref:Uncharacterized protein n=1 Tax=Puccinia graminis f. sp. tritici TaxID=56615 RepID=A0A5B0RRJ0_PUCGR|nr:hypothetical protein PGT21_001964 [Puccinia graminis f. sp. tritici]KAA1127898.1 hypothetical protein PGTUg99_007468 [Puccinia graminis f. sp. tritici]
MAKAHPYIGQLPSGDHSKHLVSGPPLPSQLAASSSHPFVGKHATGPDPSKRHFILNRAVPKMGPNQVKGHCSLTICGTTGSMGPALEEPGNRYRYYYYSVTRDWLNADLLFKALIMRGRGEAVLRIESHNPRTVVIKLWYPYQRTFSSNIDLGPGQSMRFGIPIGVGWPTKNAPELHFMGYKDELVPSVYNSQKGMQSNPLSLNVPHWQQPIKHHLPPTSASYNYHPVQSNHAGTELTRPFQNIQLKHMSTVPPPSMDLTNALPSFASTFLESDQLVRTPGSSEEDHLGFVTPLTFEYLPSGSARDQADEE